MQEMAVHPLLARFWKREGVRDAENNSMTLADTRYTIRLDDEPRLITVVECEVCCYTAVSTIRRTFHGMWEPICMDSDKVVLILHGTNEKGEAVWPSR